MFVQMVVAEAAEHQYAREAVIGDVSSGRSWSTQRYVSVER